MGIRLIAGIIATIMFFIAMVIELVLPSGSNPKKLISRITAFILGGIGLIALWISVFAP